MHSWLDACSLRDVQLPALKMLQLQAKSNRKKERKEVVSHLPIVGNQVLERKYWLILEAFRNTD